MVLADPALQRLRREYGVEPLFATFAANAATMELVGTVPRECRFAFHIERPWKLPSEAWRFARWARRMDVNAVVDMELLSNMTALLAVLSGASRRAGFYPFPGERGARGALYTVRVPYNPHLHMAKNFLRLSEAVISGAPHSRVISDRELVLHRRVPGRAAVVAVDRLLVQRLPSEENRSGETPLILINPNGSRLLPQRRWPEGHFVELVEQLLERHPSLGAVLIGSAEDRPTTAAITRRVGARRCVNLAGEVALEWLPALFERACLMVSNDSGPAHFAALTGLPVVVLFGPETPLLYRPLGNVRVLSAGLACSPCVTAAGRRATRCRDNQCMQQIAVDQVAEEVESILRHEALRALSERKGEVAEPLAATLRSLESSRRRAATLSTRSGGRA